MKAEANSAPTGMAALWDNIKTIIYALLLAMCIRVVIAQPFRIPSGSMQPTLRVGDYIVVTKWSYGYSRFSLAPLHFGPAGRLFGKTPEQGDVIVFRPRSQPNRDLVKRLVGMPGDRIQVLDGVLHINGAAVKREFLGARPFTEQTGVTRDIDAWLETLPNGKQYVTFDRTPEGALDMTDVFEVPEGHYFMMGDDRDHSQDSRTVDVGYVPYDNLVGKTRFVFMSFDETTSIFKPWTLITGFRAERFIHGVR